LTTRDLIAQRLTDALGPCAILEVEDQSAAHAGHAGARQSGGGHFAVLIVSASFEGQSQLQRQRRVYAALADELKGRIHALSMICLTPSEHAAEV
jgi:BolA protein